VTVMLLAIIGFMACVFYLVVLIQWVRDTRRATSIVSMAKNRATKGRPSAHAGVVGFRKDVARGRRMAAQSSLRTTAAERHFEVSGPGWSASERNAYETIARSLTGGREACTRSGVNPTHKAS
jgi:hypothetical protein